MHDGSYTLHRCCRNASPWCGTVPVNNNTWSGYKSRLLRVASPASRWDSFTSCVLRTYPSTCVHLQRLRKTHSPVPPDSFYECIQSKHSMGRSHQYHHRRRWMLCSTLPARNRKHDDAGRQCMFNNDPRAPNARVWSQVSAHAPMQP